jgi:hypothetical protein
LVERWSSCEKVQPPSTWQILRWCLISKRLFWRENQVSGGDSVYIGDVWFVLHRYLCVINWCLRFRYVWTISGRECREVQICASLSWLYWREHQVSEICVYRGGL